MSATLLRRVLFPTILLFTIGPTVTAQDWSDLYGQARDLYRRGKKELALEIKRQQELVESRRERTDRRLEREKEEAVQTASPEERSTVEQEYRAIQQQTKRAFDRRSDRVEDWGGRVHGQMRREYESAKHRLKYRPLDGNIEHGLHLPRPAHWPSFPWLLKSSPVPWALDRESGGSGAEGGKRDASGQREDSLPSASEANAPTYRTIPRPSHPRARSDRRRGLWMYGN